MRKRKAMQGDEFNLYLTYAGKRLQALANHPDGLYKNLKLEHIEKVNNNFSLLEKIKKIFAKAEMSWVTRFLDNNKRKEKQEVNLPDISTTQIRF